MVSKATHVASGLFLISLGLDPVGTMLGVLLPDIDTICCHRKLLHNAFMLGLATATLGTATGTGMLAHILLDMLTVNGVAVLWPITDRRFGLRPCKTGGWCDRLLGGIFTVAALLKFGGIL